MDIIERIYEINNTKGPAGLSRMRRLLELLGNPEKELQIFHVGGTNGKGSVSYYIKSLLEAAGFSVGMFTSPHVEKFNERFQISDKLISDEDFERLAESILKYNNQLVDEGYGGLSLFEVLTALAYLYFTEKKPDYVIMEVGIGGRIDVTNTIEKPLATVIAQVGIDHVDVLGDTVEEITEDKACIIKAGVPVVTQSAEDNIREIIYRVAGEKEAPLLDVETMPYEILDYAEESDEGLHAVFNAEIDGRRYEKLRISMLGEHQVRNAITALAAVTAVMDLSDASIRKGLIEAVNPGRFEMLRKNKPIIVIDGAHNESGIAAAIDTYRKTIGKTVPDNKLLLVFGCLKDKKCDNMVEELADAFRDADKLMLQPDSSRALPASELKIMFNERGCDCEASDKLMTLFEYERLSAYDAVLVLGSIYLIGEIKTLYNSL